MNTLQEQSNLDLEGNRLFWQNIISYNENTIDDFGKASELLGNFLQGQAKWGHENLPKDYVENLPKVANVEWGKNFISPSSPPEGLNWFERILWRFADSQYVTANNQAVATNAMIEAMPEAWDWLKGALAGDFAESPTVSQVITGGLISMIPFVDQVCDIRDLIANLIQLSDEEGRAKTENWVILAITCIGLIPEAGSAIKTVVKAAKVPNVSKGMILELMEKLESNLSKINLNTPWGRAPETWLKTRPWVTVAENAKKSSEEFLKRLDDQVTHYAEWFKKNTTENPKLISIFENFRDTVQSARQKIGSYIDQVCQEIDETFRRLLNEPKYATAHGSDPLPNQTGQYSVNVSVSGGSSHRHQQPARDIRPIPPSRYPNAKPLTKNADGRYIDPKTGKPFTNAGPHAPDFKKWEDSGGVIKYDDATGTVIYGKEMKTSTMGDGMVEVPYKNGPPDNQRYPDFSDFKSENVNIKMTGLPESKITPPETGDFSKAWEQLEQQKGEKYINEVYGINKRQSGQRAGSWPDTSPKGQTWHHSGNGNDMELVDGAVHRQFTHRGGASGARGE